MAASRKRVAEDYHVVQRNIHQPTIQFNILQPDWASDYHFQKQLRSENAHLFTDRSCADMAPRIPSLIALCVKSILNRERSWASLPFKKDDWKQAPQLRYCVGCTAWTTDPVILPITRNIGAPFKIPDSAYSMHRWHWRMDHPLGVVRTIRETKYALLDSENKLWYYDLNEDKVLKTPGVWWTKENLGDYLTAVTFP